MNSELTMIAGQRRSLICQAVKLINMSSDNKLDAKSEWKFEIDENCQDKISHERNTYENSIRHRLR